MSIARGSNYPLSALDSLGQVVRSYPFAIGWWTTPARKETISVVVLLHTLLDWAIGVLTDQLPQAWRRFWNSLLLRRAAPPSGANCRHPRDHRGTRSLRNSPRPNW